MFRWMGHTLKSLGRSMTFRRAALLTIEAETPPPEDALRAPTIEEVCGGRILRPKGRIAEGLPPIRVRWLPMTTVWQMLDSKGCEPSTPNSAVWEQAMQISDILRQLEIDPLRIGIDGLPGCGKRSLASALASLLEMRWKTLEDEELVTRGALDESGTIYEHHRLFRTQDVEAFDVIIHSDEPVKRSWSRLFDRKLDTVTGIMLDHRRLQEIGGVAFEVCGGEQLAIPGGDFVVKVKPPGGFRARENIMSRLAAKGLDGANLGKEESLFLLVCGRRPEGVKSYVLGPARADSPVGRLIAGLVDAPEPSAAVASHPPAPAGPSM